uniref:Respirasome Complex Assembly Factor 1 n=1 Tax=Peromyscus maniculatus bairdii TaxID=230844 RepID=A0A8C8UGA3_PERMB
LSGTRRAPPGAPSPGRLSRTPHPAEATRAGKPPGKDEFLDVIYWFRQIIAVVSGVIWGILPLRGFLGIAGFCLINAGVLYLYFSNYLQIDAEEYGGTWELTKEGFMTSFALFMVIWIIFYTAIHYDFAPISTVQSKGPFY